jgi:hypothetical protein
LRDPYNTPTNSSGVEDSSPKGLRQWGDQQSKEGLFKEAADAYTESIAGNPESHSTYLKLAFAYYGMREPADGDAVLQRLVDLNLDDTTVYRELIGFYLSINQWGKANETAARCVTLDIKDTNYHLAKSVSAAANGDGDA